jgi:hypothetical protein
MWGFSAVFFLSFPFVVWLARPAAADVTPVGGPGSVAAVGVAMFFTLVGTVAAVAPWATPVRWLVGMGRVLPGVLRRAVRQAWAGETTYWRR